MLSLIQPVVAQGPASVTLYATSCTLYPSSGDNSCTIGTNGASEANSNDILPVCLSHTQSSSLSVSVAIEGGGSTCQNNDIRFDFTVTYTPTTCTAGQYQATFKANNSAGYGTEGFTANVHCPFVPLP